MIGAAELLLIGTVAVISKKKKKPVTIVVDILGG